jgi:hypothetical protein
MMAGALPANTLSPAISHKDPVFIQPPFPFYSWGNTMAEVQMTDTDNRDPNLEQEIRLASRAALASLLNLTFLPGIAFVWLLLLLRKTPQQNIVRYHALFGIRLNLTAAFALLVVSALMILLGGFDSAWTWVYVITYFTFVHTVFIVVAVWAMVRSWSGDRMSRIDRAELIGSD